MMELALRFTHAAAQVLWVGALVALAVFAVERLAVRTAAGRHALHLLGLILMALFASNICLLNASARSTGSA